MKKKYSIIMEKMKTKKAVSLLTLALVTSMNLTAQTWSGATNTDFGTASNWTGGVLPDLTGAVVIAATANYPVVAAPTVSTFTTLALNAGASLNVQGTLTASGVSYTGGTIVIDGGKLDARRNLFLGTENNPANVTVNSGVLNIRQNFIVGEKGPCVLNINGGEVSVDQNANGKVIFIGSYYSSGIVNLNGGFLKTGPENVGTGALAIVESPKHPVNGTGYLNINGGTLVLTGNQKTFIEGYVSANKIRTVEGKKIVITVIPGTPAIIADPTAVPPIVGVPAVGTITNVKAETNLGLDSKTLDNTFSVYPNPSKGVINIDTKNANLGNLNISVYNLLGQQITTAQLEGNNSGSYILDATTKLTPGTYIVYVKSNSSNYSTKIVVK